MIRNSELWGGAVLARLGAYVVFAGRDMGLGTLASAGPRFCLLWVGILMCALALAVVGQARRHGGPTLASLWAGTRWRKVLVVVALLLVYGVAFEPIGSSSARCRSLLVLMWFIDPVRWWLALLVAVVRRPASGGVLKRLQLIQLPAGHFRDLAERTMDILAGLGQGFAVALQPINLLYCFIGVFIGTLVGVLPGIGPVVGDVAAAAGDAVGHRPRPAIIMMAGIYYGSMYGGSTTSILVNIPGEAASVVTCIDGHQMARQGRAGPALGIAALGSFFAGTFAIVALMLVAPRSRASPSPSARPSISA